jgi:hypothetical protein
MIREETSSREALTSIFYPLSSHWRTRLRLAAKRPCGVTAITNGHYSVLYLLSSMLYPQPAPLRLAAERKIDIHAHTET